jgi:flagellar motor switch/type III secretory pathway protein FliN
MDSSNLGFLEGVPVELEAELGRRVITLGEVIAWKPGSVVRLARATGAALDLYAGGALVGRAEVLPRGRGRKVQVTEVGDVE